MNASHLPAYMACPIIRESRLVRDLTMPERCWDRYDVPSYERNPGFVQHSRERNKKRKPGKVCAFHRRQAS